MSQTPLSCYSLRVDISYKTEEEALVAGGKYARENGPIEFDGMNCNDYLEDEQEECDGWDGESRRCNCGNRRVSLEIGKNSDGSFYVMACAY